MTRAPEQWSERFSVLPFIYRSHHRPPLWRELMAIALPFTAPKLRAKTEVDPGEVVTATITPQETVWPVFLQRDGAGVWFTVESLKIGGREQLRSGPLGLAYITDGYPLELDVCRLRGTVRGGPVVELAPESIELRLRNHGPDSVPLRFAFLVRRLERQ